MPLTPEEQEKLKQLNLKIEDAAASIGTAIREGSATVAKSAVRTLRDWLKTFEELLGPEKKE